MEFTEKATLGVILIVAIVSAIFLFTTKADIGEAKRSIGYDQFQKSNYQLPPQETTYQKTTYTSDSDYHIDSTADKSTKRFDYKSKTEQETGIYYIDNTKQTNGGQECVCSYAVVPVFHDCPNTGGKSLTLEPDPGNIMKTNYPPPSACMAQCNDKKSSDDSKLDGNCYTHCQKRLAEVVNNRGEYDRVINNWDWNMNSLKDAASKSNTDITSCKDYPLRGSFQRAKKDNKQWYVYPLCGSPCGDSQSTAVTT
ncbi:hypothetical protein COV18_01360 [Candidatus Woesearchaeota archaeon CG10_big_fil_rev_8_21_14_0_10_37_12]|nr:MAG: hypothetical protein COV18_01360 [Candidatus Woesearchaeota archaeon CG10_big_fil_rev_8_21_14_0_10_37_12]